MWTGDNTQPPGLLRPANQISLIIKVGDFTPNKDKMLQVGQGESLQHDVVDTTVASHYRYF